MSRSDRLSNEEHNEVLVEIVEVAGIPLVEVVGELGFAVVVRGDARILGHDAEGVSVKHDSKNTGHSLRVTVNGGTVHLAGIGKGEVRTGSLPEGDSLSTDELGVLIVECARLQEHVRSRTELGEHDDVLKLLRGKPLLPALVKEGSHAGEPVDVQGHLIRSIADEVGVQNGLGSREIFAVLRVESGKKVDGARVSSSRDSARRMKGGVAGLQDHIVDGAHDKGVHANSHGLVDLVEEHRNESIELGGRGKALLNLALGDAPVDLERGHLIEELSLRIGLVEDVGVIGGTVLELPAFVLGSGGHFARDFFNHGAVLPSVTHDRGG